MNPTEPPYMTDAERVAGWSAVALQEQRYELGYALARLAVQASRVEDPEVPVPPAVPIRAAVSPQTPWLAPNGQITNPGTFRPGGFEQRPTSPPVLRAVENAMHQEAPVPSYRCVAQTTRDGVADECHGVLYAAEGGFRHVHAELDSDHIAVPGS